MFFTLNSKIIFSGSVKACQCGSTNLILDNKFTYQGANKEENDLITYFSLQNSKEIFLILNLFTFFVNILPKQ